MSSENAIQSEDFKAGMKYAAEIAAKCTSWYEGHGDNIGELAADEIRSRIVMEVRDDSK